MNITSFRKMINSKIFRLAVFLAVISFTFILRAHNYERVPVADHLDEMLYAWSGLYLIETGVPVSWSTLDYPEWAEVFKGKISYMGGPPEASVNLYRPWLDEPPLFSLIVGAVAHQFGADRTQFIPSSFIRIPVVFLAFLTSIVIFLCARLVSGFWTGILAVIIYGTTPILVFASRTAMPENLIAFLFALSVYLVIKFIKKPSFYYLIPIPFLAGIGGLAKPTGYFIMPLVLYLVFAELVKSDRLKSAFKYCAYLILALIPFIVAFFAYGFYFNPEIFWKVTEIQGHRPVGFNSLTWFFISPSFETHILKDSWYIFGLLSAVYFIFSPKDGIKRFISLSFVYWIIVMMLSGGEGDLLSWYRFPAFPFLAILSAWGIEFIVKKADFFVTFLAAGLLLGNRLLLSNAFRPNVDAASYRSIFSLLMVPSLVRFAFDKVWLEKLCRVIVVIIITVGLYFNIIYIYNAYDILCENKTCPMVPTTKLSSLHFPIIWRWMVLPPLK